MKKEKMEKQVIILNNESKGGLDWIVYESYDKKLLFEAYDGEELFQDVRRFWTFEKAEEFTKKYNRKYNAIMEEL